jgi:DNA repair photolyase
MEDVGDRQTNWRGYLDVDSFEDYCEDKLGISVKTGYGLISSYSKLTSEKPEYLTDNKLIPPPETKVRILGNKKFKSLEEGSSTYYNEIKDMIFNSDFSRRETENKLEYYHDSLLYDEDEFDDDQIEYDPLKESIRQYWKGKESAILGTIRENNQSKFSGLLNGLYDLGQNENSTRVESTEIKRIVITNTAKDSEYAKEVIKRARKLNHKVEVSYTGTGNNDTDILAFPSQLQGAENYWYMKETLFVRERKTPFIETFPSPGDIVENLNTALKLGFHCRSTCHYCYQQKAPYIYQEIFTNFDKLKKEIIYEPFVHRATLVIWSVISFLTERTFNRIPNDLDKSISKFRASAIKAEILDNSSMIQFLPENITQVLIDCKIDFKEQDLKKEIAKIPTYYEMNKKTPLWLWVSEYSDILAIEPIAKQMEYIFTDLLPVNPEVNFMVSTKTADEECFLKYDGQNRVMLNMNLSPEEVIYKYEPGTSPLDKRLDLIKKLQDKGGYILRLSFEPMINFEGWQEAYKNLVETVSQSIDLASIPAIVLGSIRLRDRLKTEIVRNYPWTDLFKDEEACVKATKKDKRGRYTEEIRISQYQLMIDELKKHTKAEIILGAEYPEMWDWVGLDKEKFMSDKIFQYCV